MKKNHKNTTEHSTEWICAQHKRSSNQSTHPPIHPSIYPSIQENNEGKTHCHQEGKSLRLAVLWVRCLCLLCQASLQQKKINK
jgi:hypothetical protein